MNVARTTCPAITGKKILPDLIPMRKNATGIKNHGTANEAWQEFQDRQTAEKRERYLKSGCGRRWLLRHLH
jgi:hypothetical protein